MSRPARIVLLLMLAMGAVQARHHHYTEPEESPVVFNAGGVQFVVPTTWQAQPPDTSARAGQWIVPPAVGESGDGVQIVAFFFGPGIGGSSKDNIEGWAGTITAPDGTNASTVPQKRAVLGHAITEVMFTGTYAQQSPQPGLPPTPKPDYALLGAVVENPGGTIYWRVTGPTGRVLALAPILDKVLDSLKPQPPAPASTP
jgi:hypothetical protein